MRLVRVHPGGRLVEQEDARVRRRRARDLEPAPVRVRERVRRLVPAVAHQPLAEEAELLLGERVDLALLAPRRGRAQDRLRTRAPCVWPYAAAITFSFTVMFRNSRSVWNVRAMPRRRDLCGARPTSDSAVEQDVALVGPVDARDEVEQRGLAGPVRPDHADDLALVDVQVELVDHLQAAERLRDRFSSSRRAAPSSHAGHQTISTRGVPSRPCGRAVISATSSAPSRRIARHARLGDEHGSPRRTRPGRASARAATVRTGPRICVSTSTRGDQERRSRCCRAGSSRSGARPSRPAGRRTCRPRSCRDVPGRPDRVHQLVGDDAEERPSRRSDRRQRPGPHERDQAEQDRAVEEPARVGGVAQELERDVDHDRAERRRPAGCRRRRGSPSRRS